MTEYNEKTEDNFSRQIKPVLYNTAKDGSGTWYFPVVDADGNMVVGAGTALIGKVGIDQTTPGTTNGVRVTFGGAVYENEDTATADTARRFETASTKLRDVIIQISGYGQLFGTATNQRYLLDVGDTWNLKKVDISTLYFKNATAGQNGVVNIIGVRE